LPFADSSDPTRGIDLNCDLGESYGPWTLGGTDGDAELLTVVTSANVACGFHAGDPRTLQRTVDAAGQAGVVVGAQVSYPDLVGFGRRAMDLAPEDLGADVLYQIGALEAFCRVVGTRVAYVKPHGALYHRVTDDPEQAVAVLAGSGSLPVLGFPGSQLLALAAAAGRAAYTEGFPDRGYRDGRLVDRSERDALLTDDDAIARQAVVLAGDVASLCVHGDSPGAVEHAHAVRRALEAVGYRLCPFVDGS
jgi:UPF0271 protein